MATRNKADETTRRLLELAAEEFIERGYELARVNDIARRAGLTSGAVYGRWPHKEDVMVAALDHIFEQILPERRLKGEGADTMKPPDMMERLGDSLLSKDQRRDVLVQVFGSAHNNDAIRERLQEFLDEEARQLGRVVEEGKEAGFCDPAYSTAAIAFLSQALGIGAHLLLAGGLDDSYIPSESDWNTLLLSVINAVSSEPLQPHPDQPA